MARARAAVTVFDDGTGPALYAVGAFTTVGGVPANRIAKWDGSQWSALGDGIGAPGSKEHAQTLAVFDDGRGSALYAGGRFLFDRGMSQWSAMDPWIERGFCTSVNSLALSDQGGGVFLFDGGYFVRSGHPEDIALWHRNRGVRWPLGRKARDKELLGGLAVVDPRAEAPNSSGFAPPSDAFGDITASLAVRKTHIRSMGSSG